jgi:DNA-binding CsgD family transcriptional regulator
VSAAGPAREAVAIVIKARGTALLALAPDGDRSSADVAHTALAVLGRLAVGLWVVDAKMHLVLASGPAAACGFEVRCGRLGMASGEDERKLRAAVAAVIGAEGEPACGLWFGPATEPTRAIVTAVEGAAPGAAPRRLAVIIIPPASAPDHPGNVIQGMFGLTRVEAAVTKLLSDGVPPNEAAARMRMSLNTLRGYMKAIFAKLGVHRQSELVRLVSTTAGVMRSPQQAPAPRVGGAEQ